MRKQVIPTSRRANPTSTVSFEVADKLYLVQQQYAVVQSAAPKPLPTNFIVVIDCSGSMAGDLPRVREQLKRKLPKLLNEGDTISVIWFSGRNQFGTLLKAEPVATLADLQEVNHAIDRWLKPVGMTGFCDPLHEVSKLVKELHEKKNHNPFALVFMSDGADNQWPREQIMGVATTLSAFISQTTFVEYGYYADRAMLAAMAAAAGGTHIHASDFDAYAPAFERLVATRSPQVEHMATKAEGEPIGGFVWEPHDKDLRTYAATGGSCRELSLPATTRSIFYLCEEPVGDVIDTSYLDSAAAPKAPVVDFRAPLSPLYQAMSLFATRMLPEIVLALLKKTGDVSFAKRFSRLFGKQQYSEFMDAAKAAAFDPALRYVEGKSANVVPRDDAFSILELLTLFQEDSENRLLLEHPEFKYSRIGRKRINADSVFSDEEQEEVVQLGLRQAEAAKAGDVEGVRLLGEKMQKILGDKPMPLVFLPTVSADGYSVSNLTFNEEKPNVSVLVKKYGTVDTRHRKSASAGAAPAGVPDEVSTFVWRNYAIIKDGLVNVDTLPVKLSPSTLEALFQAHREGRLSDDAVVVKADGLTLINLKALPILNRKQAARPSAKDLFANEWRLLKVQATQKVFKAALAELAAKKEVGKSFAEVYGEEAARWMVGEGFSEHSGFSPKMVTAPATDAYKARELKVSIKGYSSLPSVNEVRKQMLDKKVSAAGELMKYAVLAIDNHKKNFSEEDLLIWLTSSNDVLDKGRRALISEKACLLFAVVVGQTWFSEFSSLDEAMMVFEADGLQLTGKAVMSEVEVKI